MADFDTALQEAHTTSDICKACRASWTYIGPRCEQEARLHSDILRSRSGCQARLQETWVEVNVVNDLKPMIKSNKKHYIHAHAKLRGFEVEENIRLRLLMS